MDDINKPTSAVTDISAETLEKLASREEDIRNSGVIDIFEQHLPQIPKDYVFKQRDRKFVQDALHAAFDLTGGVPRLVKYAHENYGDYIKLFARLLPEAQKQETGMAVVQVFHNVPASALDMTDITDMVDFDDALIASIRSRSNTYLAPQRMQSGNSGINSFVSVRQLISPSKWCAPACGKPHFCLWRRRRS